MRAVVLFIVVVCLVAVPVIHCTVIVRPVVPARFSAHFKITPVYTDHPGAMAYQGVVTKHENSATPQIQVDAISLHDHHAPRHRFVYTNADMYLLSQNNAACLPRAQYPPLHELEGALAKASLLTGSSYLPRIGSCRGDLWTVPFAGREYVVCTNEAGLLQTVFGEEFTLEITDLQESADVATNNALFDRLKSIDCPKAATYYNVHHTRPAQDHKWFSGESELSKAQRSLPSNATQRVCVFLHGSGVQHDEPTSDSFTEYWGQMGNFTPQCSSRRFVHMDTWSRGWTSPILQKMFCQVSLDDDGSDVITNKIVFTHSMGNLILAAAIQNGVCSIDMKTTSWFAVQAPINGSKGALVLEKLCNSSDETIRRILNDLTYCNGTAGDTAAAYKSMIPGYPGLHGVEKMIFKYSKGRLCGTSAWGLNTPYSVALSAIADVVNYGEENDGMVGLSACSEAPELNLYQPMYNATYYIPTVNHADGTCRNGNGWWGLARDPCTWYGYRGADYTPSN
eukprot:TRINITY_DN1119_c0_g1_i1.p1 TRINITY_DN1119_c0_g1~~TRINITY_DN1119_c0_g1_i1.p1  ORF type:complete len:509 (+),score=35.09 TRINITY_DN1119_c0_g1_i1:101-1627(+)